VAAVSALSVPAARADILPDSYAQLLAHDSITVTEPDPSFVPGVEPYDAEWLARLLHGQSYLIGFTRFWEPTRTAWLIVTPHFFIPNLGPRGGAGWCGIAFIFTDASSGQWIFTYAVGQELATRPPFCWDTARR